MARPGFTLNLAPLRLTKKRMDDCAKYRVKVGILKETNDRDDGEGNADVGFKMEFGSRGQTSFTSDAQMAARGRGFMSWPAGWPARSFIRMPIMMHFPQAVVNEGEAYWRKAFEHGGVKTLLEWLGFLANAVVLEAFDTGGYGSWPKNSRRTILWKKSSKPLIDSSQLERSITSKVVP